MTREKWYPISEESDTLMELVLWKLDYTTLLGYLLSEFFSYSLWLCASLESWTWESSLILWHILSSSTSYLCSGVQSLKCGGFDQPKSEQVICPSFGMFIIIKY